MGCVPQQEMPSALNDFDRYSSCYSNYYPISYPTVRWTSCPGFVFASAATDENPVLSEPGLADVPGVGFAAVLAGAQFFVGFQASSARLCPAGD